MLQAGAEKWLNKSHERNEQKCEPRPLWTAWASYQRNRYCRDMLVGACVQSLPSFLLPSWCFTSTETVWLIRNGAGRMG